MYHIIIIITSYYNYHFDCYWYFNCFVITLFDVVTTAICNTNPCINGACIPDSDGNFVRCSCFTGYQGTLCDTSSKIWLILLFSRSCSVYSLFSGYVGRNYWKKVLPIIWTILGWGDSQSCQNRPPIPALLQDSDYTLWISVLWRTPACHPYVYKSPQLSEKWYSL